MILKEHMLSCLAPWGAHLGHPVATDGSFLVGAGRVHSNQLASLVGCEVAQTWTCFQVNPDNTPKEVILGGRLVYKQDTKTLADPPKTGFERAATRHVIVQATDEQ